MLLSTEYLSSHLPPAVFIHRVEGLGNFTPPLRPVHSIYVPHPMRATTISTTTTITLLLLDNASSLISRAAHPALDRATRNHKLESHTGNTSRISTTDPKGQLNLLRCAAHNPPLSRFAFWSHSVTVSSCLRHKRRYSTKESLSSHDLGLYGANDKPTGQ